MVAVTQTCKVFHGLYDQGTVIFGETAGIQCAGMLLFVISYSTIKEISRLNQFDLDILLVNGFGKER